MIICFTIKKANTQNSIIKKVLGSECSTIVVVNPKYSVNEKTSRQKQNIKIIIASIIENNNLTDALLDKNIGSIIN